MTSGITYLDSISQTNILWASSDSFGLFITADIFTCPREESTGVTNRISDDSVPVSHKCVTVSQQEQYQDPDPVDIDFSVHTYWNIIVWILF